MIKKRIFVKKVNRIRSLKHHPMTSFNQIKKNYDCLSRWYDLIEGWGEKSICDCAIRLINIQPGEKALEIGSGTGSNLLRVSQSVNNCKIVGLDLSYKMCRQTCKKGEGKNDSLSGITNANAIQLPFPKNHFDALLFLFTFEIIPEKYFPLVLNECKRVLKPNGRLCIGSMSAEKMGHLMMKLYLWSTIHFPQIVDCRPIDLKSIIEIAEFETSINQFQSLWGLPVRILIANKRYRREDEDTNLSN
jgi:ubiquinone/menaquinone biosynthesis C-methylase UbiE